MSDRFNPSVNILMLIKHAHFVVLSMKQVLFFFLDFNITNKYWVDLSSYIFNPTNETHNFILKDICFITKTQNRHLLNMLLISFYVQKHKQTWLKYPLCFPLFLVDFDSHVSSLKIHYDEKFNHFIVLFSVHNLM